jgi:hypothetical protein
MAERIDYARNVRLPKLAWFARVDLVDHRVAVEHGTAVECNERWMVEGVWDGEYAAGAFHEDAHLFGSGIRLEQERVHIVPSCALVDRLVYCRDGGELLVSNSLPLLLARTGARLIPRHDYRADARAIMRGLYKHDPAFRVTHPRIEHFFQLYYRSLIVEDGRVSMKLDALPRHFTGFADYRAALSRTVGTLVANYRDAARRAPLSGYGTLSNGYDSTTVACLAKEFGVRHYFSYRGSWAGARTECDTAPIAAALRVEPIWLEAAAGNTCEDERYMHAASPAGFQLPLLQIATHIERSGSAAAVFTGYHGDIMWGLKPDGNDRAADIFRHDLSGLDLSEVRLKAGFVHVAVPFLFARSVASIRAISRSAEMEPWRLYNDYDRPICRRIVETEGVARPLFGAKKHGLLGTTSRPVDAQLRERYMSYLDAAYGMGRTRALARLALDRLASLGLRQTARALPAAGPLLPVKNKLDARFWRLMDGESLMQDGVNFRVALYAWSVEELSSEIARLGQGARPAAGDSRGSRLP